MAPQAIWKKGAAVCPVCKVPAEVNEQIVTRCAGRWKKGVFYADGWQSDYSDDGEITLFCSECIQQLELPEHWDDKTRLWWG